MNGFKYLSVLKIVDSTFIHRIKSECQIFYSIFRLKKKSSITSIQIEQSYEWIQSIRAQYSSDISVYVVETAIPNIVVRTNRKICNVIVIASLCVSIHMMNERKTYRLCYALCWICLCKHDDMYYVSWERAGKEERATTTTKKYPHTINHNL